MTMETVETCRHAEPAAIHPEPPVGLLAGSGRFPIYFAEKARALGRAVVCVGIRHEAAPELAKLVHRFYWTGVARLGRTIRCFQREGVKRVVMAGKVHKADVMHGPWRLLSLLPDWRTFRTFLMRSRDNRDDALLLAVIDEFARDGLTFDSALNLCPELLVRQGILTRRGPTAREQRDVAFGWEMAKEM
ncbi:MAG TPA: hypothetical protein VKE94_15945, partial [Gemmataceae bacterium]|nr:hypothetical protein [Gemmataceae bacterium]